MSAVWIFVQLFLGWVYGHVAEYVIHRWVLHGFAKKKGHPLAFHFREHHSNARLLLMADPIYKKISWNAGGKELAGIFILLAVHAPVLIWLPWFYVAILGSALSYYLVHRMSHTDPRWGRTELSWHYDHHMGPNQDANYGIRSDVIDRLLGTKEAYYGTSDERRDYSKRLIRKMRWRRARTRIWQKDHNEPRERR